MSGGARGDVVSRLRAAGSVFAEDEAAVLLAAASTPAELERLVSRRVLGEPLEVIVGWADFRGLRIGVEPGVFVPRARTGVLVDVATPLLRPGSVVVDLCCGTGAVGVALHDRQPAITLHATDIEPAAVRCARANIERIGGVVWQGDLFAALPASLRGAVDVLVVNAPYVPSDAIGLMPPEAREHEPRVALDGGADGVDIHRRVAAGAREWLAPAGRLIIETSRRQAALTSAAFEAAGLTARVVTDEDIDGTAVVGATVVPA
ncbi:putative protein N(5)-glutamine methyltransferase [Aeromicrobium wangtongii]|uniref:putative protein N(5)-glutamine methyltransferase n=1 Tax=Aeromicrobium wangtongii TaxID=2969247 RepID=UPI002017EA66|nr:putative protein N(5)-glutamine methyltransferase [Aeromicrobium wangtongii]MCL3818344.1 putative protein N(5)-glutamine methyltransferase [Aeromicrobium wangtongii]